MPAPPAIESPRRQRRLAQVAPSPGSLADSVEDSSGDERQRVAATAAAPGRDAGDDDDDVAEGAPEQLAPGTPTRIPEVDRHDGSSPARSPAATRDRPAAGTTTSTNKSAGGATAAAAADGLGAGEFTTVEEAAEAEEALAAALLAEVSQQCDVLDNLVAEAAAEAEAAAAEEYEDETDSEEEEKQTEEVLAKMAAAYATADAELRALAEKLGQGGALEVRGAEEEALLPAVAEGEGEGEEQEEEQAAGSGLLWLRGYCAVM